MFFNISIYAAFMILGYHLGNVTGFKRGAESVDFERYVAQQKINQCMRIVRSH
ncbi:MAG: hypothetical protein RLZ35_213 [Pseudomonadota bacterium]|jgi:hypothetical protein